MFKGIVNAKMKMNSLFKCLSPQNIFGVSGLNCIAAKSDTIEVTVDSFFKRKKNKGP